MKLTTFEVAIDTGRGNPPGRDTRRGYVIGDWGTHKEDYFWTFTHLPTGVCVNVYPCHSTKASALAHLAKLADGTAPQCATVEALLSKFGRGWGLADSLKNLIEKLPT